MSVRNEKVLSKKTGLFGNSKSETGIFWERALSGTSKKDSKSKNVVAAVKMNTQLFMAHMDMFNLV